ncbi:MAG: hypothetical protein BWZ02_03255 [Lentisphaerae bacterium ADurb.BinA184]|nr:MAG: hypothetical protein BWZ02_03255 [Lentisphaerae bacterium ADurb.BinA184]
MALPAGLRKTRIQPLRGEHSSWPITPPGNSRMFRRAADSIHSPGQIPKSMASPSPTRRNATQYSHRTGRTPRRQNSRRPNDRKDNPTRG